MRGLVFEESLYRDNILGQIMYLLLIFTAIYFFMYTYILLYTHGLVSILAIF